MKEMTVKQHMQSIAPLGGKALLKKRGRQYYVDMRKKAIADKKAKLIK